MKKSLLITYFFPPKIGGIENYLWNVCQGLPKDKIVVLTDSNLVDSPGALCPASPGALCPASPGALAPGSVYRTEFFALKFFKPSWLPLIWKIWGIIKREKIEILQFGHYAHYCLIGTLFKKLFNHKILGKIFHYDALEHHSKIIIYIHGVDFWIHQRGWFGRWLMKLNFKNADKIITNSYFMRGEILKIGVGEEKVMVVQPGIDYKKFQCVGLQDDGIQCHPEGATLTSSETRGKESERRIPWLSGNRVSLKATGSFGPMSTSGLRMTRATGSFVPRRVRRGPQDDKSHGILRSDEYIGPQDDIIPNSKFKIILSLGRLIKLKGYDIVLKALPEVIKKVPNLIYLIVGEGEAEKELKDLVKKLNLEKYVIFAGAVKGPEEARAPYYALADVFVGPSREIQYKNYKHIESFGLVYLEAAAAGKPVIATRIGGIPEAVLDDRTGILIPQNDPQFLAQALIKLLIDKELAEKLGKQGKERVMREFSWESRIDKIVRELE